jgi:hypothetical protein
MPIYMSNYRQIDIRTPSVCCDGCSRSTVLVVELTDDFRLVKSAETLAGPAYVVVGMPSTEEEARAEIIERGWIATTLYGKEMVFCPECQKKGAVEKSQPEQAETPSEAKIVGDQGWEIMKDAPDALREGYALGRVLIEMSQIKPEKHQLLLLRLTTLLRSSGSPMNAFGQPGAVEKSEPEQAETPSEAKTA